MRRRVALSVLFLGLLLAPVIWLSNVQSEEAPVGTGIGVWNLKNGSAEAYTSPAAPGTTAVSVDIEYTIPFPASNIGVLQLAMKNPTGDDWAIIDTEGVFTGDGTYHDAELEGVAPFDTEVGDVIVVAVYLTQITPWQTILLKDTWVGTAVVQPVVP